MILDAIGLTLEWLRETLFKKLNGNIVYRRHRRKAPEHKTWASEDIADGLSLANITLLDKVPVTATHRDNAVRKIMGNINRIGTDSATVEEIIDHTVNVSVNQKVPHIWLLQYASRVDKHTRRKNVHHPQT